MKPKMIYVAGPYTSNEAENTNIAMDIGLKIFKKGHFPYIPHLTHWLDARAQETKVEMTWEDYMAYHKPYLEACDALYFIKSSKGADIEMADAVELGKIIYTSLREVPTVGEPDEQLKLEGF
jgi:hypothetical protein